MKELNLFPTIPNFSGFIWQKIETTGLKNVGAFFVKTREKKFYRDFAPPSGELVNSNAENKCLIFRTEFITPFYVGKNFKHG